MHLSAHHRDIAGVITNAVFLLEAGLMRLIDNDQTWIGERQEQGRARADEYFSAAIGNGAPHPSPLGRAHVRMPYRWFDPEPRGKAFQKRLSQCDFRQQNQHLFVQPDGFGHCLEIGFGLARSGYPVEHDRVELFSAHRFHHRLGGGGLSFA